MSYQTVVACVLTLLTTVADKHHIGHRSVAIEYHDIGARYMLLEIHGYLALYSVTVSDKKGNDLGEYYVIILQPNKTSNKTVGRDTRAETSVYNRNALQVCLYYFCGHVSFEVT